MICGWNVDETLFTPSRKSECGHLGFGHPALLVTVRHLSMFSNTIGLLLFICDPFLMSGQFEDFPRHCRLSGQPLSLPQWFTVLVNPHYFWFQVLDFALWCFTEGSSKPWNSSMLHFFLWSLYLATGFVSAWIAGNISLALRKCPKSVDVSKTKTSRSQKVQPCLRSCIEAPSLWSWLWNNEVLHYPCIAKMEQSVVLYKDWRTRPQIVRKCLLPTAATALSRSGGGL